MRSGYAVWEKVLGEGNVGNMLFANHGVALYGHSYITRSELAENRPDLVKGFLRATYKGWANTYREPDAAIDAIAAAVDGIDKKTCRANLDIIPASLRVDLSIQGQAQSGWAHVSG